MAKYTLLETGNHVTARQHLAYLICQTGWGTRTWKVTHNPDWTVRGLEAAGTYPDWKHAHDAILADDRDAYGRIEDRPVCGFCLAYPAPTPDGRFCSDDCKKRDAAVDRWTAKSVWPAA